MLVIYCQIEMLFTKPKKCAIIYIESTKTKTKINTRMKRLRTAKFFGIATVFVLAVVFLSSQGLASTKSGVDQAEVLDNQIKLVSGEYVSPVFEANFNFNLAGFAWQGNTEEEVKIYLRFYNNNWSKWYSPESENYFEKDGWYYNTEPVLASQADRIQYKIETPGEVEQVKLIYISTYKKDQLKKWNFFDWFFTQASAESELDIIPRADWEADEEWRLNSSNEEVWPIEYQWPEKFVIHHTAGSDGGDNVAATIQGVYYWHAVVLGWGDIGYNYIIDQEGNIYEGRYGGDGAIGAHVYRSAICAEQRFGGKEFENDFNPGTIGIAVLGDYQGSDLAVNNKVKAALTTLIASKAKEFEIEPEGESYMNDDIYANIVGHKDMDCTDCPGKNLYAYLPTLVTSAQEEFALLGGVINPITKATYISQSEQPVTVNAGEEKQVWVDFKNTGNTTWRNYTQNTLSVMAKGDQSNFYVAAWSSPKQVASLTTANVAPGEVGRFMFIIKAPEDQLELTEQFVLSLGDQILSNTSFTITAQISGFDYASAMYEQDILPATFDNAVQVVTLQFKNRGLQIWEQGEIKLNIYDPGDQVSRFYDKSWPDEYGQFDFVEDEVGANELATFIFKLRSPAELGLFKNIYRLSGNKEMIQIDDYSLTRVDSVYQAEIVSSNIPPAMLNVWRIPAEVKFKNTGVAVWDRSIVLKAYDLGDKISRFKGNDWLDNYTMARLSERTVAPGEIGTFTSQFDATVEPGLYFNRFELSRGSSVFQSGEFYQITRVD